MSYDHINDLLYQTIKLKLSFKWTASHKTQNIFDLTGKFCCYSSYPDIYSKQMKAQQQTFKGVCVCTELCFAALNSLVQAPDRSLRGAEGS